ncbi:MAG: site-specific integrase [Lactobacillus sp.]|nr:MAG: site-specific integrase [Lactobacillus sp.]
MVNIKGYQTSNGQKRYEFQLYTGTNSQTGKQERTRRRGFKTKKEANIALSKLRLQLTRSEHPEKANNIPFSEVYKEWYVQYIHTVRESTFARTEGMFDNHILPEFGNKRIRTITADQIQKAVNKWYKQTTYNYKRWYNYTASVLDFGKRRGYINRWEPNPARMIVMPKKHDDFDDKPENFWSKQELETFFNLIDKEKQPEQYALFRLLAFGGLRRGEILALKWSDLNTTECTVSIQRTLTQGRKGKQIVQPPKTHKSRRKIILDSRTMNILKHWRLIQQQRYLKLGINTINNDQLMFANRYNRHKVLNCPSKWLHALIDGTSLKPITVHGFRHTHASALFAGGASIKEVQDRLGHQDAQTTLNIYTHVTKDQNKEAVIKLASYLNF